MKHPKLFFGNMVIAISMCVPLLAFAGCDPHGPGAWLENIIRIAFDAARRKAMEE